MSLWFDTIAPVAAPTGLTILQHPNIFNASTNSLSITLPGTTAGSLLVAAVATAGTWATMNFSTTAGSTSAWTTDQSGINAGNGGCAVGHATVSASGSITVTFTSTGPPLSVSLVVFELANASGYDTALSANVGPSSGTTTTPSITPAASGELIIGLLGGLAVNGSSAPFTFTTTPTQSNGIAYSIAPTAAAIACTFTGVQTGFPAET